MRLVAVSPHPARLGVFSCSDGDSADCRRRLHAFDGLCREDAVGGCFPSPSAAGSPLLLRWRQRRLPSAATRFRWVVPRRCGWWLLPLTQRGWESALAPMETAPTAVGGYTPSVDRAVTIQLGAGSPHPARRKVPSCSDEDGADCRRRLHAFGWPCRDRAKIKDALAGLVHRRGDHVLLG